MYADTKSISVAELLERMTETDAELASIEAAVERRITSWDTETDGDKSHDKMKTRARSRPAKKRRSQRVKKPHEGAGKDSTMRHVEEAKLAKERMFETAVSRFVARPQQSICNAMSAQSSLHVPDRSTRTIAPDQTQDDLLCTRRFSARNTHVNGKPNIEVEASNAKMFVEHHRKEVGEYGASALSKKNKTEFETRKRLEQGCKPLKQQKMPLPMLLGMRKKQRLRNVKAKELALASGMLVRSKRRC